MIIYENVFKGFQKERVKFMLIGGLAVNLHGSLRSTADMDVLVEMSEDNLKRINGVLQKCGYRLRQPVKLVEMANKKNRLKLMAQKSLKALTFYDKTGLNEVDILVVSPVSYERAEKNVQKVKVGSLTIPLIGLDDLIRMKTKVGRAIDRFDVRELRRIKQLKGTRK